MNMSEWKESVNQIRDKFEKWVPAKTFAAGKGFGLGCWVSFVSLNQDLHEEDVQTFTRYPIGHFSTYLVIRCEWGPAFWDKMWHVSWPRACG